MKTRMKLAAGALIFTMGLSACGDDANLADAGASEGTDNAVVFSGDTGNPEQEQAFVDYMQAEGRSEDAVLMAKCAYADLVKAKGSDWIDEILSTPEPGPQDQMTVMSAVTVCGNKIYQ